MRVKITKYRQREKNFVYWYGSLYDTKGKPHIIWIARKEAAALWESIQITVKETRKTPI